MEFPACPSPYLGGPRRPVMQCTKQECSMRCGFGASGCAADAVDGSVSPGDPPRAPASGCLLYTSPSPRDSTSS
eukprot:10779722-Prorocentrum_lima.AAC.1